MKSAGREVPAGVEAGPVGGGLVVAPHLPAGNNLAAGYRIPASDAQSDIGSAKRAAGSPESAARPGVAVLTAGDVALLQRAAERYRAAWRVSAEGFVVIWAGQAVGWVVPDENLSGIGWKPGATAVRADGVCYRAVGGDFHRGADCWVRVEVAGLISGGADE